MNLRRSLSIALLALGALCAAPYAAELPTSPVDQLAQEEDDFLHVDEAFVLTAEVAPDGAVLARWEMPDGYYRYRHRFDFDVRTSGDEPATGIELADAEIPPGKSKIDEYFGEVEIYYHSAQARVPVSAPRQGSAPARPEPGRPVPQWRSRSSLRRSATGSSPRG